MKMKCSAGEGATFEGTEVLPVVGVLTGEWVIERWCLADDLGIQVLRVGGRDRSCRLVRAGVFTCMVGLAFACECRLAGRITVA